MDISEEAEAVGIEIVQVVHAGNSAAWIQAAGVDPESLYFAMAVLHPWIWRPSLDDEAVGETQDGRNAQENPVHMMRALWCEGFAAGLRYAREQSILTRP